MARNKLQVFTDFANMLLPHETAYLLSVQQLADQKKLEILKTVHLNCTNIRQFTPFDVSIDKRKYSNLKNWIQKKLKVIDVDQEFNWMIEMERQIMTDALLPEQERVLIQKIKTYQHPTFFFTKFYELALAYRHYLLIRLRYKDYELTEQFLQSHAAAYQESNRINEQLHEATRDITQQYADHNTESIQWERWLRSVFFDERLDGHNRYMAFVRLSFIAFNYRKFDMLWEAMEHLDNSFSEGIYYSKRLLLNYYHLRMLLHAKIGDFDQAVHYGFLSIRGKNNDYLFYINNLSAVLLRAGRAQEALQVMRNASPEMKASKNFHNKVGFVAFYVQCLLKNQMLTHAVNYCSSFLKAYEKEILQYRWHTFFSAYLEALLLQGKFTDILFLEERLQLLKLEKQYQNRTDYTPSVAWYIYCAQYKNDQLSKEDFSQKLQTYLQEYAGQTPQNNSLDALLQTLRQVVPEIINYLHLAYKYTASS